MGRTGHDGGRTRWRGWSWVRDDGAVVPRPSWVTSMTHRSSTFSMHDIRQIQQQEYKKLIHKRETR